MGWDGIYAHLLTCFPGWTWEYIDDHIDLPRMLALLNYQKENPPVHKLLAIFMGGSKKQSTTAPQQSVEEFSDIIPSERLSSVEFNELLRSHGLPCDE